MTALTPLRPPGSTWSDAPVPDPVVELVVEPDDDPAYAALARRAADAAGLAWLCRTRHQESGVPPAGGVITMLTAGALQAVGDQPVERDRGALVLAARPDDPALLHRALQTGAAAVVGIDDELEVLEQVRRARDVSRRASRTGGPVLAVRPVCGGAGASVLAAAIAVHASSAGPGRGTTLVDADPHGDLGLLLGEEWGASAGWDRLADLDGQVDATWLHDRLPVQGRLRVVTHGPGRRRPPPVTRVGLVVAAAAAAGDLVVVDLPSTGTGPLAVQVQHELWVVPCTAPAVAAAARRLADEDATGAARLPSTATAAGVRRWVVARRARAGLHPEEVAATLGLPLAADVRHDVRIDEHVALGLGVAPRRRSAYARAARSVLSTVLSSALPSGEGR